MKLNADQLRQFDEQGYHFFPNCFAEEEIALMRSGANLALVDLNKGEATKAARMLAQSFDEENPDAEKKPEVTAHYSDVSDPKSVEATVKEILDVRSIRQAENWDRHARVEDVMDLESFVHLRTHIWRSLREELRMLGHRHVGVTAVCPSYVATGMFDGAAPPTATWLLTPEAVADALVRAVERDREQVVLPWTVRSLLALTGVLPRGARRRLCAWLGVSTSMRGWKGHPPAQPPPTT